jgi:hypothetical protein
VDLRWQFVYSAMLGRLSYSFPVNVKTGVGNAAAANVGFTGGDGEMVRYAKDGEPIEPYKTRIGAVIVLERLALGERYFKIAVRRREREMGREATLEEYLTLAFDLPVPRFAEELRFVVCSNPYAPIEFPQELFSGPYDERFGKSEAHIKRTFVGDQLNRLEQEEAEIGLVKPRV